MVKGCPNSIHPCAHFKNMYSLTSRRSRPPTHHGRRHRHAHHRRRDHHHGRRQLHASPRPHHIRGLGLAAVPSVSPQLGRSNSMSLRFPDPSMRSTHQVTGTAPSRQRAAGGHLQRRRSPHRPGLRRKKRRVCRGASRGDCCSGLHRLLIKVAARSPS